jgi:DNA helicase HerA-like ATPase
MGGRPLGIVSSKPDPPSTISCWIELIDIDTIRKGAFVILRDAKRPNVEFIGQVIDIINSSVILGDSYREEILRSGKTAEDIVAGSLSRPEYFKSFAKIKLMYKVTNGQKIDPVDTPPTDTSPLLGLALNNLSTILGFSTNIQVAACLGFLYSCPNIPVCLDLNKMLEGHIAVFGQTGSGKSYAAGVLIEEAVEKGIPVIVFDHMGEYLSMNKGVDGGKGLNLIELVPGVNMTIDFDDLIKASPILTALGVTDAQLNLLRDAYMEAESHKLRGLKAVKWLLEDTVTPEGKKRKRIYSIGRSKGYSTATIDGLRWKLESLLGKGVIGGGFNVVDVIKPGHLTVVNLSEIDPSIRSLVVAVMLNKIAEFRRKGIIPPLLVVIEEAHNYVPTEETPSSLMIRDLIRGARHWGVSVMLISQRPSGIHRDALNIINTHIIFRLKGNDLDYIKQFTPFTKEELDDIQTLPEGIAYIAGPVIREGLSVKVSIRKRKTVHGGHSVKFV